jgi:hypothetical protein
MKPKPPRERDQRALERPKSSRTFLGDRGLKFAAGLVSVTDTKYRLKTNHVQVVLDAVKARKAMRTARVGA